jgi:hypothetical protein
MLLFSRVFKKDYPLNGITGSGTGPGWGCGLCCRLGVFGGVVCELVTVKLLLLVEECALFVT